MANKNTSPDFSLAKDAYISFDALSLKQHIKDRLSQSGIFTDQNFEGSNIASVTDLIAFTFHVLMFYLNKTSNESLFSGAQLYENMNRIVKALDYKPIGFQTSTLAFKASAANFTKDLYTIPRYSFITIGDIPYSFNEDVTFAKTVDNVEEELTELSKQKLLFQGKYAEYPLYTATGSENELFFLVPGDGEIIDHFNIDVYVKSGNGTWEQFERTPSLYLENAFASKYEIRLNENRNYEIKFGNDINGRKLQTGDQVAVYYLRSQGADGEVGARALFGHRLFKFDTTQFNAIITDVTEGQYGLLNNTQLSNLSFNNETISTYVSEAETAEDIRTNAPSTFRSQYRLVTEGDYETFVRTNFANLIHDVKVVNNATYLTEQLKYYYDLGISKPNRESRVLYNQVNFSDACNFNNVYILCVPRVIANPTVFNSFLTPAQKELIISSMRTEKTLTAEVVLVDPIYTAFTPAINETSVNPTIDDINNSKLLLIKDPFTRRDDASIKADVQNVFLQYFDRSNVTLGQQIDLNKLSADILAVPGLKTFFTARTDSSTKYEGLGLMAWNPVYSNIDFTLTFKNLNLQYFKFPYLHNANSFLDKIDIINEQVYENVDY